MHETNRANGSYWEHVLHSHERIKQAQLRAMLIITSLFCTRWQGYEHGNRRD
jgi:hypothetical protein